eukprot:6469841-Amphidinium_carterae.1
MEGEPMDCDHLSCKAKLPKCAKTAKCKKGKEKKVYKSGMTNLVYSKHYRRAEKKWKKLPLAARKVKLLVPLSQTLHSCMQHMSLSNLAAAVNIQFRGESKSSCKQSCGSAQFRFPYWFSTILHSSLLLSSTVGSAMD